MQVRDKQCELEEVRDLLVQSHEQVASAKLEANKWEQQQEERTAALVETEHQLAANQGKLQEANLRLQQVLVQCDEKDQRIAELLQQQTDKEGALQQLQQQTEASSDELMSLKEQRASQQADLDAQLLEFAKQSEEAESQLLEKTTMLKELDHDVQQRHNSLQTISQELSDKQAELQAAIEHYTALQSDLQAAEDKLHTMSITTTNTVEQINNYELQRADLEQQVASLQAEHVAKSAQLCELQQQCSAKQAEFEQCNQDTIAAVLEVQTVKVQLAALEQELDMKQQQLADKEQAHAAALHASSLEHAETMQQREQALQAAILAHEAAVKRQVEELAQLQQTRRDNMAEELEMVQADKEDLQQLVTDLRTQLGELYQHLDDRVAEQVEQRVRVACLSAVAAAIKRFLGQIAVLMQIPTQQSLSDYDAQMKSQLAALQQEIQRVYSSEDYAATITADPEREVAEPSKAKKALTGSGHRDQHNERQPAPSADEIEDDVTGGRTDGCRDTAQLHQVDHMGDAAASNPLFEPMDLVDDPEQAAQDALLAAATVADAIMAATGGTGTVTVSTTVTNTVTNAVMAAATLATDDGRTADVDFNMAVDDSSAPAAQGSLAPIPEDSVVSSEPELPLFQALDAGSRRGRATIAVRAQPAGSGVSGSSTIKAGRAARKSSKAAESDKHNGSEPVEAVSTGAAAEVSAAATPAASSGRGITDTRTRRSSAATGPAVSGATSDGAVSKGTGVVSTRRRSAATAAAAAGQAAAGKVVGRSTTVAAEMAGADSQPQQAVRPTRSSSRSQQQQPARSSGGPAKSSETVSKATRPSASGTQGRGGKRKPEVRGELAVVVISTQCSLNPYQSCAGLQVECQVCDLLLA